MIRFPTLALTLLLAASAAAQTADELTEARGALQRSTEVGDGVEAERLAAEALPALLARAKSPDVTCYELFLLAEAQIRAALPTDALGTERRAGELSCDEADRLQLRAWALEFAPDGVRRGEGAKLRASEATYLRAANLLAERTEKDFARIAGCLGNAAELAELRGDHLVAYERAVHGLRLAPTPLQREQLGLSVLVSGAPLHGEGSCLDLVGAHVEEGQLVRLADVRLQRLRKRLDRGHDDAASLASVAFYALLAGTPYELFNAERYLKEAIALSDDLPDVWYLMARVHEERQRIPEAKQAYRRQVEKQPQAASSRLAVNALAYLEAEVLESLEAGESVLALLDTEIELTPREAPFHDTRARLLAALGRKEEACTEAMHALQLAKDDEFRGEVLRFQRAQGCAFN